MIAALLGGLETVFGWLLEASWQASVLVVLVLLLQVALRGRLNPRWYHALWLLVIARLLLPFLPESALSLFQFAPSPPPVVTETMTESIFNAPAAPMVVGLTPTPAPAAAYPFSIFTVLALIWFAGAVGLFILTWQVNRRFTRHAGAAPLVADPHLLMLAEAAQQEFGLHRRLRIIESAQIQSPAIMGLIRPTLILPKEVRARFADAELRFIFLHEFAHLKRGDLFLQWLIALLQILHWFNPVLWYAFRRMRIDREPATDALVLSRTGEEQKEPYGQVLVKLLEHYHQRHSLPTLVGILEDKDQFKRRFSLIARFARGAYGWSLSGVLIIGILSVACLTKSKATKTAATVDSKPTVASVSFPPVDASKRQVQLEFKLVQIDEKTYISYQKKIDAEVANSDLVSLINQINNLPGVSLLSAPSVTTQDGLKANVDIVREMPYATQFDKDKDGKIVPSDFKTRDVGLSIEGTPTLTADKQYVRLKFKCKLTSFEGWKEIPTGGRLPIFDTASTETERLIGKHGDAVWVGESGETRAYLTVGNGNNGPPSTNDTASKRILLLVSARPVPAEVPSSTNADPTPLLLTAVQKGDSATVQNLINQGADPKAVDKDGRTLLFDAGSPKVAQLLIADGVDVNTRDKSNDLALHNICRNGGKNASAIVGVLLQHGADPNSRAGQLGETPLMDARDGSTVDVLMEHGANPKITMASGENVFFWLSWSNPSALEALLRHGLPFNQKTDGATMLLHATWTHNIPLVKWLLEHGVDPNIPGIWVTNNGHPDMMLPIQAAAISGVPEAAKLLLEHGAKAGNQMIVALQNRYPKVVKLLWDAGVRDISSLCYAVSQGASAADVQKLLDQGSPADPPQDKEITPLADAAMLGNMDVVKLLIAHNADVNAGGWLDAKAPKYWKRTPLCLAAAEGQDEAVAYLLQHGATPDPAALYQAGFNSYPYAEQLSKDHFEKTVRILIDAGALKNVTPDMAGLVLAGPLGTRQGPPNSTVLKMILDAGVSPESPMPYLAENGEKPNTVIGYYREYYQKRKDDPTYAQSAATIKPLLDMLEAADKSAKKATTDVQTPTNRATAIDLRAAVTLQQAIDWDRDDFAKSLLDSGTKASQLDFIYALKASRPKIVSLFWNHGLHGCSPMSFAISQGASAAEVEAMLNAGAKVEPDEDTELSPLCVACAFGNSPSASVLLAHSANPNWIGKSRDPMSSPLWMAIGRRQPEIAQLLLDHGAVPEGSDVDVALGDLSAEMKARAPAIYYQRASDCFRMLVAHGALKKVPTYMKASVLCNACLQVQDMDVVKTLLAHGFHPTDNDAVGDTALSRVRDAVEGRNNWPTSPQFKPFLDLLEAADKAAPKASTDI